MRWRFGIVALLLLRAGIVEAQTPVWHSDVGGTALAEAWDRNETSESLAGIKVGVDRRVWKAFTVRAEGLLLRVTQVGENAWVRGVTIGTRSRWQGGRLDPFLDLAVGISHATQRVPPRGTQRNYVMIAGGGVALPFRSSLIVELAARWLHLSNNSLEGRHRNPDIQALGAVIAVGWRH